MKDLTKKAKQKALYQAQADFIWELYQSEPKPITDSMFYHIGAIGVTYKEMWDSRRFKVVFELNPERLQTVRNKTDKIICCYKNTIEVSARVLPESKNWLGRFLDDVYRQSDAYRMISRDGSAFILENQIITKYNDTIRTSIYHNNAKVYPLSKDNLVKLESLLDR
jgi:hypothetical protein